MCLLHCLLPHYHTMLYSHHDLYHLLYRISLRYHMHLHHYMHFFHYIYFLHPLCHIYQHCIPPIPRDHILSVPSLFHPDILYPVLRNRLLLYLLFHHMTYHDPKLYYRYPACHYALPIYQKFCLCCYAFLV